MSILLEDKYLFTSCKKMGNIFLLIKKYEQVTDDDDAELQFSGNYYLSRLKSLL